MAASLFLDIETRSRRNVTVCGAHELAKDPELQLLCVCYAIGDGEVKTWDCVFHNGDPEAHAPIPADLAEALADDETIIYAWNEAFERLILNSPVVRKRYGLPRLPLKRFLCLMSWARAFNLPGSLDQCTKEWLPKDKAKLDGSPTKWMWSKAKPLLPEHEDAYRNGQVPYCERDVGSMRDMFLLLPDPDPTFIQEYHAAARVNDRGCAMDLDLVSAAITLAPVVDKEIRDELDEITTSQVKPRGPSLRAWLEKVLPEELSELLYATKKYRKGFGWGQRIRPSTDKNVRAALLAAMDDYEGMADVREALALYDEANRAAVTKYAAARDRTDEQEGVLRGQYLFCGASQTGRFSSTGMQCVTGDHDVLTRQGWMPIKDAVGGCEIMAWDAASDTMRWETGVIRRFEGAQELVAVNGTIIRGVYTPDHRMPNVLHKQMVDWTPERIEAVKSRGGFKVSAPVEGQGLALSDDAIRLCVAMQADGHWAKGAATWRFVKRRKIARLTRLLTNEGIRFSHRIEKDGVHGFRVNVGDVPTWLVKPFGPWVLQMSARQAQLALAEISRWDGWRHGRNGAVCITQMHKEQLEWIATIAALAGEQATLNKFGAYWRIYIRSSKTTTLHSKDLTRVPGQDVFCPTVPSGYWLCRYGDRIYITGNTHNLIRKVPKDALAYIDAILTCDPDVIRKRTGMTVNQALSLVLRTAFIAKLGRKLVWGDWSAIEARMLPWLSGDPDAERVLDAYRNNEDLYIQEAAGIYNKPASAIDKDERQAGKVVILACGFNGGVGAYQAMAKNYGLSIPDAEAARIVQAWRKNNPWARRFWRRLEKSAKRAILNPGTIFEAGRIKFIFVPGLLRGTLMAFLPSGRPLVYPEASIVTIEKFGKDTDTIVFRHPTFGMTDTYGGKIAENVTQGESASLLRNLIVRLEQRGEDVVLHTHDEAMLEADEAAARDKARRLHRMMLVVPEWAPGLPLAAEVEYGSRYKVPEGAWPEAA